jgi:hypothetical protein
MSAVAEKVADDILGGLVPIKQAVRVVDVSTPSRSRGCFVAPDTFYLLMEAGMHRADPRVTPEIIEALQLGFEAPVADLICELTRLTEPKPNPYAPPGRVELLHAAIDVANALNTII